MKWGGWCRALLAFHRLNHEQSCNMAVSVMEVPKRGGGWTRWSGSQNRSCFQLTAALARTLAALIQMHQRKEENSPFVIRWLCPIRLFHQNSVSVSFSCFSKVLLSNFSPPPHIWFHFFPSAFFFLCPSFFPFFSFPLMFFPLSPPPALLLFYFSRLLFFVIILQLLSVLISSSFLILFFSRSFPSFSK